MIILPEGTTLEKSPRLGISATNNEAEYKAFQMGLAAVLKLGGKSIRAYCDS